MECYVWVYGEVEKLKHLKDRYDVLSMRTAGGKRDKGDKLSYQKRLKPTPSFVDGQISRSPQTDGSKHISQHFPI